MIASEPLPHFVDDLLGYLHETHPTYATLDGVHTHDDLLEDFSRQAVERESHALAGYLRRLEEIDGEGLTSTERLEHRMLAANIRGRMFELEEIRTWEKNPQYYADTLASSIAGQALFTHAPAAERRLDSHSARVFDRVGGNPRNVNVSLGNPDAANAAIAALGPGIASTRMPASIAS